MILAVLLGLLAGIASTVQASINAEARRFFRSPFLTAWLNFTVAGIALVVFIIAAEHRFYIPMAQIAQNPPWIWTGGICGVMIVILNIVCLPKLGAANNVMLIDFGQIMTGLVIDHFAMFGSEKAAMSPARFVGAVLVIAGMLLVTRDKGSAAAESEKRSLPPLYVVLAFICGVACSAQIAINGALKVVIGSASKATFISMSVAFLTMMVICAVLTAVKGRDGVFDPDAERGVRFRPWMLIGGFFALTVVSSNAVAGPVIGTGLATIMNLIGMMGAGLAIDATGFLGIEKQPVTFRKVAGMLLMLGGTAIISFI